MAVQTVRCRSGLTAHGDGTLECEDPYCSTSGTNPDTALQQHVVVVLCRRPGCARCP